jgi:hypothetical protein
MVTHMKTTIDIADALLTEAKTMATKEGTTVRSLVEEGLRLALARRREGKAFELRPASFGAGGVKADVSLDDWQAINTLIYQGHGGGRG